MSIIQDDVVTALRAHPYLKLWGPDLVVPFQGDRLFKRPRGFCKEMGTQRLVSYHAGRAVAEIYDSLTICSVDPLKRQIPPDDIAQRWRAMLRLAASGFGHPTEAISFVSLQKWATRDLHPTPIVVLDSVNAWLFTLPICDIFWGTIGVDVNGCVAMGIWEPLAIKEGAVV